MARAPTILIVDDESAIRETLADYLALHGMHPEKLDSGQALRARVAMDEPFDMALLDVTMPGEDGLSLARWLRETTQAGIIMVTARGEALDRIIGLEIGADDYVTKPVDLRELLARVRAVLRRMAAEGNGQPAPRDDGDVLRIGGLVIDAGKRTVQGPDGKDTMLTSMEFDLLLVMARRAGRVLSRDQLLELSNKDPDVPFDRSIDIRIARLRRKLERDPARPRILKTVRGAGYVFDPKPD